MANLSMADINPWGRNAGCSFAMDKCVSNGVVSNPNFFCAAGTATQRAEQCASSLRSKGAEQWRRPKCASSHESSVCVESRNASARHRWRIATRVEAVLASAHAGYCDLKNYTAALEPQFQYFANPTTGGSSDLMDYCPLVRACAQPQSVASSRVRPTGECRAAVFARTEGCAALAAGRFAPSGPRTAPVGLSRAELCGMCAPLPQVPTATAPARTLPIGLAPPMARHRPRPAPPRRPPLPLAKTDVRTHTEAHPLTRARTYLLAH